jgi:A/G-specific adenine glycosylase
VQQGLPYYLAFTNQFPTLRELATAKEQEILRTWQGLGYYTRARNMYACAKILIDNYNGEFPSSSKELQELPGVGPYTAAAIASISFEEVIPVVDGNVYRVLSRIFGVWENAFSGKGRKIFNDLAYEQISRKRPGDYNQAIMEFGALQCRPVNPSCEECILRSACYAYYNDHISSLPVKEKRKKSRIRYFHYFVIVRNGRVFMHKRMHKDIWNGLYQFLLFESSDRLLSNLPTHIREHLGEITVQNPELNIRHVLSHQVIHAYFYYYDFGHTDRDIYHSNLQDKSGYYSIEEIRQLPKPVLIENYLKERFF